MYFTKIRLNGLTTIDLPKVDALPSDQFILKSADGLGPPEIDVSIADTLNAGGVYQGRRPQSRELVFLIGLNPDFRVGQTAADLRTILYGMLTPGYTDRILVEIMNGDRVLVTTVGYAKKLEIVPFSKDPEVQLTISCTQQYLQAPAPLYIPPPDKAAPEILNIGTAPAGFHMELIFTGAGSSWTLSDPSGKKMEFNEAYSAGDTLIIDTRPGLRHVHAVSGGIEFNVIYTLSVDSIWYMLYGGMNSFLTSSQDFDWGDIYYLPQYWGI